MIHGIKNKYNKIFSMISGYAPHNKELVNNKEWNEISSKQSCWPNVTDTYSVVTTNNTYISPDHLASSPFVITLSSDKPCNISLK